MSTRRKSPPILMVCLPKVFERSSETCTWLVLRPCGLMQSRPPRSSGKPCPIGGFAQGLGPAVLKKVPSASPNVVGKIPEVAFLVLKTAEYHWPATRNWFVMVGPNECAHSNWP